MQKVKSLLQLYLDTTNCEFIHVDNGGGDYHVEKEKDTLWISLEGSSGAKDWLHNFDFWKKPYKGMEHKWYVHRGFLKIWKGMEDILLSYIMDKTVQRIIVSGFSQGAALAFLCHEWCTFHRPDLMEKHAIESYGFGQPRVTWGHVPKEVKKRFKGFTYIVCKRDIVTHLPPRLFGFHHCGRKVKTGKGFKYGPIKSHLSYAEYLSYVEDYTPYLHTR